MAGPSQRGLEGTIGLQGQPAAGERRVQDHHPEPFVWQQSCAGKGCCESPGVPVTALGLDAIGGWPRRQPCHPRSATPHQLSPILPRHGPARRRQQSRGVTAGARHPVRNRRERHFKNPKCTKRGLRGCPEEFPGLGFAAPGGNPKPPPQARSRSASPGSRVCRSRDPDPRLGATPGPPCAPSPAPAPLSPAPAPLPCPLHPLSIACTSPPAPAPFFSPHTPLQPLRPSAAPAPLRCPLPPSSAPCPLLLSPAAHRCPLLARAPLPAPRDAAVAVAAGGASRRPAGRDSG